MTKAKFLVRVEVRDYLEATTTAVVKALRDAGFTEVKVYRLDKPADHERKKASAQARFNKHMTRESKKFTDFFGIVGIVKEGPPSDMSRPELGLFDGKEHLCVGCGNGCDCPDTVERCHLCANCTSRSGTSPGRNLDTLRGA